MSRILITGSTDGVGRATAAALLDDGHEVVVHARNDDRLAAVDDLLSRGAGSVVGDLARLDEVRGIADQANELGSFDAVIHNAGIIDGPGLLAVNVVAPYALTALVAASRLIYLSSSMHLGGHAELDGLDWSGKRKTASYSDSKLFVTTLMAAVARRRTDVLSHAVDPGWVPTKMGGPGASDDLALAHPTQVWLASADPAEFEQRTGGYWNHRGLRRPHPAALDVAFQDELLSRLESATGLPLPSVS